MPRQSHNDKNMGLLPLVKGRWILRPKEEKTEGIETNGRLFYAKEFMRSRNQYYNVVCLNVES